jgi:hypothetical protein
VDTIGDKIISNAKYLRQEETMSEINIEYAHLRKAMSKANSPGNGTRLKHLQEVQQELTRILETIPQKTKTEIQLQANKLLLTQWQEKLKPLLPLSLQGATDTFIKKKIQQFDFEDALKKTDLKKVFRQNLTKKK